MIIMDARTGDCNAKKFHEKAPGKAKKNKIKSLKKEDVSH
jgi:hypothetical protein